MTTVIYHSADYDGIFCREIAKKFLGDKDVEYIGWNFGDRSIATIADQIYVLDLSPDCLANGTDSRKIIWIDHHKTSIEKWPSSIPGYRIDGVAACRLAWQWFAFIEEQKDEDDATIWPKLPSKQDFLNREVDEPLAVRLAGEYDVWDHRGDGDLEFQFGMRSVENIPWGDLLNPKDTDTALHLVDIGKVSMTYSAKMDADLVTHRSYLMEWEGLKWLCLNTGRFNSLTFAALDKPETSHDALLGFMWNGKVWTVSLYHAAHRKDLDLSEIAKKYGGGGHAGACGFTCSKIPFII